MTLEGKKNRLMTAYEYLYENGMIHSVKDLSEKMGRSRPGVSKALNGSPDYLNDKFLTAFAQKFNRISLDWLITGEGDMITQNEQVCVNNNTLDQGSLINAALAAKDETIRAKDEVIASLRETIEALRTENKLLKDRIAVLQKSDALHYKFPIGVADEKEDLTKHV